jgi:hypothetical protein
MPQETPTPHAASPQVKRPGARPPRVRAAAGAKRPQSPNGDALSRGALAGRIAAGAAIGSAALAGALLFAGKIDGKTPKRMWDKVKPAGSRPAKRTGKKNG